MNRTFSLGVLLAVVFGLIAGCNETKTATTGPAGPGSIFDAFRRGNEALASGIPGTGLGLSIVREVIEQVGGQIRVHSRPGKGSTFLVSFPAQQARPGGLMVRDTRSSKIVYEQEEPGRADPGRPDSEEASHAG